MDAYFKRGVQSKRRTPLVVRSKLKAFASSYARLSRGKPEAPTLEELESQPQKGVRNLDKPSTADMDSETRKRQYMVKLNLLKKTYPNDNIEIPSITASETMMKAQYDNFLALKASDENIDRYRKFMTYGFLGMEFILKSKLGLPADGLAREQLSNMDQYNRMLVEMGERKYMPTGEGMPVEMRLVLSMAMNSAIFVAMRKIGGATVSSDDIGPKPSAVPLGKARSMAGPSFD